MSRRVIVRRPQRRAPFVPLWLKRIRMAGFLKALDVKPVESNVVIRSNDFTEEQTLRLLIELGLESTPEPARLAVMTNLGGDAPAPLRAAHG